VRVSQRLGSRVRGAARRAAGVARARSLAARGAAEARLPGARSRCDAFVADDPEAAERPFGELLGAIDTPLEGARLARAVIALRASGRLDARLAAAALIDLASDSRELIGASLLQAVAVRAVAAQTPASSSPLEVVSGSS
jgi:hypothetical protein